MGGGNGIRRPLCRPRDGLSPRGRGKRWQRPGKGAGFRSIPAWAGETAGSLAVLLNCPVYPRVGGGNHPGGKGVAAGRGLSPRGRGKPGGAGSGGCAGRSIPAWAGETAGEVVTVLMFQVYPRVGGGNAGGSEARPHTLGLSPRGRGKLANLPDWRIQRGSIPAWAGETLRARGEQGKPGVYPRVGGGNCYKHRITPDYPGLSPRGRGKPPGHTRIGHRHRSIPAWAGETRPSRQTPRHREVYPRVGGGNVLPSDTTGNRRGLSPRGRGKLKRRRASCW